ncbi:MAG TPA: cohesin domain-containing protein [Candidatus Paceibacterota bacterium]
MKKASLPLCIAGAFFSSFLFAATASAATINIAVENSAPSVGQTMQVNVTIDTQGASANAVQAEITFPPNLFRLEKINDGSSAVSLWIDPPAGAASASGTIDLAGIIPGGFSRADGELFSFELLPLASGAGAVQVASATVLANDGAGSALPVDLGSATINVSAAGSSTAGAPGAPLTAPSVDYSAPNPFTPQIESDHNIFNGQYFLVFTTTDSGSGIDHYEVLEVPSGGSVEPRSSWHLATSPYLLTDQSLSSDIYVRAVDHDGNFIVVKVPARYPYRSWNFWILVGIAILFVIVVLLLFIWMRRWRRHT